MEFKEVKEFIELFIKNEYNFRYSEYNMQVTDGECEKIAQKVNDLIYNYEYERVTSIEERKGDAKWEERYKRNTERQIPRTLFQVKHYQNPKLGDALKRIVTSDDIWACYVSTTEKHDYPMRYDTIFYVAETNEGLKIIDSIYYGVDKKYEWDNPAKESEIYQIGKVINAGTLLAVEKYNAPEDEICLKDYNKS